MHIRPRCYPYPIITEYEENYVNCKFSSEVGFGRAGYDVRISFHVELTNPELLELLNEGKVEIVHHMECPSTCFRVVHRTANLDSSYLIKDKEVNGDLEVCTFLCAKTTLDRYTNTMLSPDYRGFKFSIEQGCIMGFAGETVLQIDKVRDDLANTSSIFSIIPNTDETVQNVQIDLQSKKVIIVLPKATYAQYGNMAKSLEAQPCMHAMFIVPALMYVLNVLKEDRANLFQYEDSYRWYKSLCKKCKSLNIEINEETLKGMDTYKVAQMILDNPVPAGVSYLVSTGGSADED